MKYNHFVLNKMQLSGNCCFFNYHSWNSCMLHWITLFVSFSLCFIGDWASAAMHYYPLRNEPIDVVIPCTDKDLDTLNLCIAGIKENCAQVRRIIVVSSYPLTDQAEWFNEAAYPFSKKTVALHLLQGNKQAAKKFLQPPSRVGWYFQQLLKFYAPFVIPEISSNILVLDSDVLFLNPVEFLDANFGGLYNPGSDNYAPYFKHAHKFLPGLHRLYPTYSGIADHMLFQRAVLEDLFLAVESHHQRPLWQAFCHCVSPEDLPLSGASEYEIYFNFVFSRTDQVHIRHLKWDNVRTLDKISDFKSQGYHYIACHKWLRQ
jgi:hypothetical protein